MVCFRAFVSSLKFLKDDVISFYNIFKLKYLMKFGQDFFFNFNLDIKCIDIYL